MVHEVEIPCPMSLSSYSPCVHDGERREGLINVNRGKDATNIRNKVQREQGHQH